MFNCVKVKFWFITRHLSDVLKFEAEFPIIIKCYLRSVDCRSSYCFRSHTDFTGTICFCTALLNVLEITWGKNVGILTVRSPSVINVPTRGLLAVEIKDLLLCGWKNLNIKRIVFKQWVSLIQILRKKLRCVAIKTHETKVIQSWLNLLECCISLAIFEFRNLATMLFNSFEKFLEIPGVLVWERDFRLYENIEDPNVMKAVIQEVKAAAH